MLTERLEGKELDYWVVRALGRRFAMRNGHPAFSKRFSPEGPANEFSIKEFKMYTYFQPSTQWQDIGPIIQEHKISLVEVEGSWNALGAKDDPILEDVLQGITPMEAACRAFVYSRYGAQVNDVDYLDECQAQKA